MVVNDNHRDPEEPAAATAGTGCERDWLTTPQNPKASFLSARSSNVSSSSGEFSSPAGKKRSAAETAAAEEDDKDEYLLVDRLICNADNCQSGRLTNIPDIYCEKGIGFLCNECLLKASGHADCNREGCQICQIVGQELTKRLLLEKCFREGSLILEETISMQLDKTREGSSEAVLSRYVVHNSNLYWNITDNRRSFSFSNLVCPEARFATLSKGSMSPIPSINSSRKTEAIPKSPAPKATPATPPPPPRRLPLAQSTPATIPKRKKFLLGSARKREV